MGTVGKKFLHLCESAFNANLLLVDRSPAVQEKTYGGRIVAAPESIDCDVSHLLFGTSLAGKNGEAVPNIISNEAIRKAALSLPINIGSMSDINAFVFDILLESGILPHKA